MPHGYSKPMASLRGVEKKTDFIPFCPCTKTGVGHQAAGTGMKHGYLFCALDFRHVCALRTPVLVGELIISVH